MQINEFDAQSTLVFRRSFLANIAVAVADAIHTAALLVIGPAKPLPVPAVIGFVILHGSAIGVLLWLAPRVRRGRCIGVTFGILSYMLFAALLGAVYAVAVGYDGSRSLLILQVVCVAVLFISFCCLLHAFVWSAQFVSKRRTGGPGE